MRDTAIYGNPVGTEAGREFERKMHAKHHAQAYLEARHEYIKTHKPFCMRFTVEGYDWEAYAPNVCTSTVDGATFVICHALTGRKSGS